MKVKVFARDLAAALMRLPPSVRAAILARKPSRPRRRTVPPPRPRSKAA